jgi:hypothetical protein
MPKTMCSKPASKPPIYSFGPAADHGSFKAAQRPDVSGDTETPKVPQSTSRTHLPAIFTV